MTWAVFGAITLQFYQQRLCVVRYLFWSHIVIQECISGFTADDYSCFTLNNMYFMMRWEKECVAFIRQVSGVLNKLLFAQLRIRDISFIPLNHIIYMLLKLNRQLTLLFSLVINSFFYGTRNNVHFIDTWLLASTYTIHIYL